jgi:alanine transaminase
MFTLSRAFSSTIKYNKLCFRASHILSVNNINPKVVEAEYAVRGELVIRADAIRAELLDPKKAFPYESIIACNIGNPQELQQKPITFFRQVLSILHYPQILNHAAVNNIFPADVIERAKAYLSSVHSTGSYTASVGLKVVREEVARFIEQRDNHPAHPDNILLTDGASSAVKAILNILITDQQDGILTPIPQYPLYTATLSLLGGSVVPYYLNEEANWGLEVQELQRSVDAAKSKGIKTRALVVINPGNPTGQCLPSDTMRAIVEFCAKNRIVLLADEVYQTNIYAATPFTSFKKIACDLKSDIELVSFHSTSKGFLGECGQRGGFMELHNFDPAVKAQIIKLQSISLCSNTSGQLMTGLMCNPPAATSPSHQLYEQEREQILASLKRRAVKVAATLNQLEGVTCNPVEGALYAFPQIRLPAGAVEAAKRINKAADVLYCLELLEATGICVVPGSGFGQKEGTFHFRTTILPTEANMDKVLQRIKVFHKNFMQKYS